MAATARIRTRLGREERREQILDAAESVLAGVDSSAVTFDEIASAARVSRALVYNYFGDRHGLVEAVYLRSVMVLDGAVADGIRAAPTVADAVAATVRAHLAVARSHCDRYRHAAGQVPFPRLAELERERVRQTALLFDGSWESQLIGQGLLRATHSMVVAWLDNGSPQPDRTEEIIVALLLGGIVGLEHVGLPVTAVRTHAVR